MTLTRRRIQPAPQAIPDRALIEALVEALIDLLDVLDGDTDLEPEPLESGGDDEDDAAWSVRWRPC